MRQVDHGEKTFYMIKDLYSDHMFIQSQISDLTTFCSVMAVINLVGRFVSGAVLVLDTRKLMKADPKYRVEKKQKDKEVAVIE